MACNAPLAAKHTNARIEPKVLIRIQTVIVVREV
jgi:hypothetical protein